MSIRLPKLFADKLKEEAEWTNSTVSLVVRRALWYYFYERLKSPP